MKLRVLVSTHSTDTASTFIVPMRSVLLVTARPLVGEGLMTRATAMQRRGSHLNVRVEADRKSTRLNSSHLVISYAVFCLKKKNDIHSLCHSSAQPLYLPPLSAACRYASPYLCVSVMSAPRLLSHVSFSPSLSHTQSEPYR